MKKKKLIVIGIDSATFDIIGPMTRAGKLPNLSRLMSDGAHGPLKSTVPPVTPPAWVSLMTGKNPGKHGVFDFYVPPSYGYERPTLNARHIKAKTIWRILSDMGLKVGVINLPMTYPPEEVNGFMIPWFQSYAHDRGDFTYPPDIMLELQKRFANCRLNCSDLESLYTTNLDRFLEGWREVFRIKEELMLYFMENKEWDVFMPVFYSIDTMQHHFWKFYDKDHPMYDAALAKKYGGVIPEFYERIDSAIGKILNKLDEDTPVIVVSDHGAGIQMGDFYLNRWLYEQGFLVFKKIYSPFWRIKFPHLFYKIIRRLGFRGIEWTVPLDQLKAIGKAIDPREGLNVSFFIDWEKTRAYAGHRSEQGIYINVKGRELSGIVERGREYEELRDAIIERLKEIKDPVSGGALDIRIYRKEEVYHGPFIDQAADLFVDLKGCEYVIQKEIYSKELFGPAKTHSGTHRHEGILILKGDGIKKNYSVTDARIIDIAPMILYSLGIPVPEDMDGRVLNDVFMEEHLKHHPVTFCDAAEFEVKEGDGDAGGEESEEMKKALRNLGYLG